MVLISSKGSCDETILGLIVRNSSVRQTVSLSIADPWWFPIVREVKNVNHILGFFFFHNVPAFLRDVVECWP